ncbi:MAG: FmdB family transcriptional regulator [Propionibacteriaceae bacterium]|nr:FmdB family transcriptional regulator [Propionibacteriaceae bacterium]
MPIYQYHCNSCGRDLEIFQHMSDPTLTTCPECQGQLRKVFSPVGIVFKGSGFYATDSKKGTTAASPAVSSADSSPSADSNTKPSSDTTSSSSPATGATPTNAATSTSPTPASSTSTASSTSPSTAPSSN